LNNDLLYKIALGQIPMVGIQTARVLLSYCGSAQAVFETPFNQLKEIPNVGQIKANSIRKNEALEIAKVELEFIEKNNIDPIYFTDKKYPSRLKLCEDAPLLFYSKGKAEFNNEKTIAIVGSRQATNYGKGFTANLVKDLSLFNPLIISGLAYGIDIEAHRASLINGVETVAVLGNGLSSIYPALHTNDARKIVKQGAVISEYNHKAIPDAQNFPKRNRIIAGMADATIVIEAKSKGGALITADIANSYHRDVFALPGRVGDLTSEGCNTLIKTNRAALIQSAADIIYLLGWEIPLETNNKGQIGLKIELSEDEKTIVDLLREKSDINIDDLGQLTQFTTGKLSGVLLSLEINGVVRAVPGKRYQLN
jgi:DNA processing protein